MTVYDLGGLIALARGAGATDAQAAILGAIAMAESGGRSDAIGDQGIPTVKWGPSVGLWQIRSLKHPERETNDVDRMRIASQLTDPKYNASVAYALYRQKGNFKGWSVFGGVKYGNYLGEAIHTMRKENGEDPLATNGVDAAFDLAGDTALAVTGFENVNSLAGALQSGALWKRIGWGAGGYFLVIAGLLVILLSNKEVKGAVQGVGGTAVSAAVGLVPGGGTVKAVAGGATKATKAVAKGAGGAAKAAGSEAAGAAKSVGSGATGAVKAAGKTVAGK